MSSPRVVLVTGANRGIGFAILQALSTRSPSDQYLLGARDLVKGTSAIKALRQLGIEARIDAIQLDVTSDQSLRTAVKMIESKYHALDVLINSAGLALIPSAPDCSDYRSAFSAVYDTNVISVALTTQLFLPLLRRSPRGQVINVSSARGSLTLSSSPSTPPTVSMPYSISKTALNALTLEFDKLAENKDVEFQCIAPGHCKTAFNGFRGSRDPLDGAKVVVELVTAEKDGFPSGFWQMEEGDDEPKTIPW
jgi:NAD(P)-dependent dehydrogenase (short-subunit alcohol dehydrogenase family)